MTDEHKKETERERGIFTTNDEDWLQGGSENTNDKKRRCRQGIQLAMEDIEKLISADPDEIENFDGIGELFDNVEENTGLNRTECARSLIALAFIITNDSIDYSELANEIDWHPRTQSERPRSSHRERSVGPPTYDVSEMLAFRNALSAGIATGRKYVRPQQEPDFNFPILKSNIKLYKEPTEANVNPDDNRLDFEVVRDIFAGRLDSASSIEDISPNFSLDDIKPGAESWDEVRLATDNVELRRDIDSFGRNRAAKYIAKDIETMVNREVVTRHELFGGDDEFGYEFPDHDGGKVEVSGEIRSARLGRLRPDDDDADHKG
ncbi:hypothetical protein JCM18237_28180 [Halorubrum luteum]